MASEIGEYDPCQVCYAAFKDHDPDTYVWYKDDVPSDGPLTDHEIETLVKRFGPQEIPPCRICGAELEIASMGGGQPTVWRCGSPGADFLGHRSGQMPEEEWSGPRQQHYRDSEFRQTQHGDRLVMRAVEELRGLRE